jgi:hypothetical protein
MSKDMLMRRRANIDNRQRRHSCARILRLLVSERRPACRAALVRLLIGSRSRPLRSTVSDRSQLFELDSSEALGLGGSK